MRTRSLVRAASVLLGLWGVVACGCEVDVTLPDQGAGVDGGSDLTPPGTPAPYGLDTRPSNPTCVAPERPQDATAVTAVPAFPNLTFSLPVDLRQAPGDPGHWYLVQKGGKVRVFANDPGTSTASDFIDVTARVNSGPNEAGLLSMAFHPQFAQNRQVFLSYTAYSSSSAANLRSTVSRFYAAADGLTANAAVEEKVFPSNDDSPNELDQPFQNHNGGNIAFGPDGLLYYGLGDGGSAGDPAKNGQNVNTLLAKILRVDVDHAATGKRYAIPTDNPFAGGGGRAEIYAWGVRNPWRWSFDRATGQLWLGDVGQDQWEEIDLVKKGGNYGWNIREGAHCYPPGAQCSTTGLIDPVIEYFHDKAVAGGSRSVTGGFVYRGSAIPELVGTYIYGEEVTGDVYALQYDAMGTPQQVTLFNAGFNISSFAEGLDGELYLLDIGGGRVLKLVRSQPPKPSTFPQKLSQTGCVDATDATKPAAGLIPYDVNVPLWSDGADKQRWLGLPDGKTIHVNSDGDWDFPIGTVFMKTFSIGGRRVETRLLMRHPDGNWGGYSYEWNDAGTDADLLPAGKSKPVGAQTWAFPGRPDCLTCHTAAAGRALGPETGQMNRDLVYPSTLRRSNQLATFEHIGLFDAPLGAAPTTLTAFPEPASTAPIADRARAYLHANCSFCHRPNSNGQGPSDWRYSTPLAMTGTCNQDPQEGTLGVSGAKLIAPGLPEKSVVSLRIHATDLNRMPPLATSIVDPTGTKLVDDWIRSLTGCP